MKVSINLFDHNKTISSIIFTKLKLKKVPEIEVP